MAPLWLDVLDQTIRACAFHRRPDLAHQLQHKRVQLLDAKLRVMVVGESKQGKSQLVNALLNAPVCAVGDDTTTAMMTVIQHADAPSAALVKSPAAAAQRAITSSAAPADRVPVAIEELAGRVVGKGLLRHPDEFVHAEVGIPRELLAPGLVLIDTPSIGGLDTHRAAPTSAALIQADAVVMVSDATQEFSGTELDFLLRVVKACPNVIVALSKTDIAPQWRRVAQSNRDHLADAGIPARLVPVSATLRLQAAQTGDKALNIESGFPDLIACLQHDILTKAELLAPHTVTVVASAAIEELATPLQAERAALAAEQPSDAMSQLHQAQQRFDELRRLSMRWQNTLTDEIFDLVSDVEYDLRDRTRKILRKVDEVFDTADPAVIWDTFKPWLEENLVEAAEANFAWLVERSHWISGKIAATFPAYRDSILPESAFRTPDDLFDSMTELEAPANGRFTLSQKVFSGLRGSYGGVVMFGLITGMTGLPLINPVSLGAGAVFGSKSLKDEGEGRLLRRQATAKAAVQRHVEDFFLKFGKDCKDVARQVQRRLRDHFTALAEELQETIVESARVAKLAADSDAADRDRRARELQRELEVLFTLHSQIQAVGEARTLAGAGPEVAAA
jgi:hypothetical protein